MIKNFFNTSEEDIFHRIINMPDFNVIRRNRRIIVANFSESPTLTIVGEHSPVGRRQPHRKMYLVTYNSCEGSSKR